MSTRFLLISLTLHLSLVLGLSFSPNKFRVSNSTTLEFELKQVDFQVGGSRQSTVDKLKRTQTKSSKLKNLLFPSTRQVIVQALKNESSGQDRNQWADHATYRSNPFHGEGLGKEQSHFVNSLWAKIDESILESWISIPFITFFTCQKY